MDDILLATLDAPTSVVEPAESGELEDGETSGLRRIEVSSLDLHSNIRSHITLTARVGPLRPVPNHLAISEGADVKGVWISPCPDLIVGEVKEWAQAAGVECVRIPAYWLERNNMNQRVVIPPDPSEKVVYALHGGAYARQSAHPTDFTSNTPRGIMKYAYSVRRSLTLEYRLSKGPNFDADLRNPFPAALIDAIAGYNYLIHEVGFSPSQIVVEGDSAGGNLALALVRYLAENRDMLDLPPPTAVVLLSPWVDLSSHSASERGSALANRGIDWIDITSANMSTIVGNFVGSSGLVYADTNRYISPAAQNPEMEAVSYKNFPRTFISVGDCEVIKDQVHVLRKRMARDLGEAVEYDEPPGGVHNITVFPWYEPDRSVLLQKVAQWIDQ